MQLHTEDPGKSGSIRALFLTCAVMLGAALGIALFTHEEETTARQPGPRTQLTAAQLAELQPAPAPPPQHAAPAPRFQPAPPPSPDDFKLDRDPEDGNGS